MFIYTFRIELKTQRKDYEQHRHIQHNIQSYIINLVFSRTQPNDFAIHQLICDDTMLYPMKEIRPSCDQLLINKNLWSLEFFDTENNMM